ncbi:store-operated calcium entry-associated regulatory factor-like isoform X2 [Hetaerina americana]
MKLEDLQAITLHENKMAASRRYSQPIPQLVCAGGSAGCHAYTPKVVLCKSEGWDGYSIQWECKADMPEKYSFGTISVICEGYDYPDDPYILKGSCSLEYTLEYSSKDYHSKGKSSYYKGSNQDRHGSQWSAVPIVIALVVFGYIIYSKFLSGNMESRQNGRPNAPDIGWNFPNSEHKENTCGGFCPPPYSSSGSAYNQYGWRNNQGNQGLGGGGGFWTGLSVGGLLGYMFGNRGNQAYTVPRTSSTYSKTFHSANEDNDESSNSMRTAKAYGGTKRR